MTDTEVMSYDDILAHFGVKGMHWGVRKDRPSAGDGLLTTAPGVRLGEDGSIDIAAGASLQRLVRSNGKSLPMKDITYASFTSYDNARYIKVIGGKGVFGGGRDQILGMTATKPIKAPTVEEATRITVNLMATDPKFRQKNTTLLGEPLSNKQLELIKRNPTGKSARAVYEMTNQKLTFDKDFDPDAPYIQKRMREEMLKNGYNALRDENDVGAKVAKSPIIIFDPQDSLKVTSSRMITDDLRKANKEQLKLYKKYGEAFMQAQGLTP